MMQGIHGHHDVEREIGPRQLFRAPAPQIPADTSGGEREHTREGSMPATSHPADASSRNQ
jgi:hypothetical protein